MTTAAEARRSVSLAYREVYLKRRLPDGTFEADWIDVSRYVNLGSLRSIDYRLDSDDFDVGLITQSNIRMSFVNASGKFNDVDDPRSLWAAFETRHLSLIKIEAGYYDRTTGAKIQEIVFQGIWDERSVETSIDDDVDVQILALDAVLAQTTVVPGTLSSAVLASDAIYTLCNRSDVTAFLGVDAANIELATDFVIDLPSTFGNKQLDRVLNEILLLSNSVMYVDQAGALVVRPRRAVGRPALRLYKNSAQGYPDNVYDIRAVNSGRHRVKNLWEWSGTNLVAKSAEHHLRRYGTSKKSFNAASVTDDAVRQALLEAALAEWQFPKQELEIVTDYMANAVEFFDLISIECEPQINRTGLAEGEPELPTPGHAVSDTAVAAAYANGLRIDPLVAYKVIAISHDIKDFKTTYKVRVKGTQLNDGYFNMVQGKSHAFTIGDDDTLDIDVSQYGFDSERTGVQILDVNNAYVTTDFTVTRPDSNTVRIASGADGDGSYVALLWEVEA